MGAHLVHVERVLERPVREACARAAAEKTEQVQAMLSARSGKPVLHGQARSRVERGRVGQGEKVPTEGAGLEDGRGQKGGGGGQDREGGREQRRSGLLDSLLHRDWSVSRKWEWGFDRGCR